MPLQPVLRRSVPDEVFDQVLEEVVCGVAAGESLPSERRLAELLGVSRASVREALQRVLPLAGGGPARRGDHRPDFRRMSGLDLLPALMVCGG